ncbi:P-loop containing nucleoside triphosphate hydrolase protein, partial [Mycena latifolia]
FHGRDAELSEIIDAFARETPRIAILGAGGMGKSTLARAVLHHSKITARYGEHRFFVGCDSAPTTAELAALIGSHIGLTHGKVLTRSIIHHFSNGPPSLLILDNIETLWEPMQSRKDVEEILSLLTDVDDLSLIITMRGAERPGKVRWSRPFLLPLRPLSLAAARQTFYDIADDFHDSRDVDKLLLLTDNMPLAIDLMANLVDYEGCSKILARWEAERTSLMSEGYNRESNLDLSISLSLSSPRITALPQSKDLLSLISMLPDGLSDVELLQSQIPIDNTHGCKAALLRTSLVYLDDNGRLKALVPIREYMQKLHPPTTQLIRPLLKYFRELLEIFSVQLGTQSMPGVVA